MQTTMTYNLLVKLPWFYLSTLNLHQCMSICLFSVLCEVEHLTLSGDELKKEVSLETFRGFYHRRSTTFFPVFEAQVRFMHMKQSAVETIITAHYFRNGF